MSDDGIIRRCRYQHQDLRVVQLESTHGCKHPPIDSGATPIGSAVRAPDKKQLRLYIKHKIQHSSDDQDIQMMTTLFPARSFTSARHSGATDVGITLRVPDIAIPGADYEDEPAQGLDKLDPHIISTWTIRKKIPIRILLGLL